MKVNRYHKLWDRPSSNLSPSLISRKPRLGRRQGSAIAIVPGTCPLFPAISKEWFDLKRTANSKERSILSEFFSHLCIFPYLRISNSINYLLTRLRHKVKETFSFLGILCFLCTNMLFSAVILTKHKRSPWLLHQRKKSSLEHWLLLQILAALGMQCEYDWSAVGYHRQVCVC